MVRKEAWLAHQVITWHKLTFMAMISKLGWILLLWHFCQFCERERERVEMFICVMSVNWQGLRKWAKSVCVGLGSQFLHKSLLDAKWGLNLSLFLFWPLEQRVNEPYSSRNGFTTPFHDEIWLKMIQHSAYDNFLGFTRKAENLVNKNILTSKLTK